MSSAGAGAERLPELTLREASRSRGRRRRSLGRRTWGALAIVATVAAAIAAGVGSGPIANPAGATQVAEFFSAAASPRLDAQFLTLTWNATLTTLAFAVLGTALSLVIGVIGGVLSSETWWRSGGRGQRRRAGGRTVGWFGARAALVVPRGIHEVVWGLFFLSVLGVDPLVAVLAIGIPFGAVTAKVFSEILDETDHAPYSALIAVGAGRPAAIAYGLLPAALSDLISYGFYRFECAIRSAAILGLIGAGGLGYEFALSEQALQYEEMWTLLYALILLSGVADVWSSLVRSRRAVPRGPAAAAVRAARTRPAGERRARRDRFLVASVALGVLLVPLSAWQIGLDVTALWAERTWELVGQLLGDALPPDLGPEGLAGILELSAITLAMSVLAIAVAFVGALLLAFPAANLGGLSGRRSGGRVGRALRLVVAGLTRALLLFLRAIPPPVWALLLLFVLLPGILPGALALAIYTLGVLGRLMAEAAENLDRRPLRALAAQGASGGQVFLYGVLPAAIPRFTAYGLYRWEVTIRETVVVGVVGAGGLGFLLDLQLASFDYSGVVSTLIALIVLTLMVDLVSAAIRRSLR